MILLDENVTIFTVGELVDYSEGTFLGGGWIEVDSTAAREEKRGGGGPCPDTDDDVPVRRRGVSGLRPRIWWGRVQARKSRRGGGGKG